MSMITATTWVPRGYAAAYPTKYVFDEDEYARISKLAKLELDDAKEGLEDAKDALKNNNGTADGKQTESGASKMDEDAADEDEKSEKGAEEDDEDLKEYDMEHYDDEPEKVDEDQDDEEEEGVNSIFGNIKSLAYYKDQNEDPYIKLPEAGDASDDEEREELQIMPTDNMVLAARIEDEVAHLEAYVY
ncbi:hypothetical protein KC362_g11098, partial [Hortaea werneckii]